MKMILLILLFRTFQSLCLDGCLKCQENKDGTPNTKCLICDAPSLYVLIDGSCFKQNLSFCLLSFTLNQCALCAEGYFLEQNNKCATNPSGVNEIKNCAFYKDYHYCRVCVKDYYLSENKMECLKVKTKITHCEVYSSATQCSSCSYGKLSLNKKACQEIEYEDPYCLFYYEGPYCTQCQDGYYLNENYYLTNLEESFSLTQTALTSYSLNYTNVLNIPKCQLIEDIFNCLDKDPINQTCKKCRDGYYLSPNKLSCTQNPVSNTSYEAVRIPYCHSVYSQDEIVNNIKKVKYLCRICYEGYYLSVNQAKCKKHTAPVLNCLIMSQAELNQCLKCQPAYFRSDIVNSQEKCHKRGENPNCKEVHELSNECKVCSDSTYIKHYNSRICSPPIVGCESYNDTGAELTCKYCKKNFYYDLATKRCLANSGSNFDPYCSFYNSDKQCILCLEAFFLNVVSGKCEPNSQEYVSKSQCQNYAIDKKDTCDKCSTSATQIKIVQTCKLFPSTIISPKSGDNLATSPDLFKVCQTFQMNQKMEITCIKVLNKTPAERAAANLDCQYNVTRAGCEVYYLDSNTNVVKKIDTSITSYSEQLQLCQQFKLETSDDKITCDQCYPSFKYIDRQFTTDNLTNGIDKIPWCQHRYGAFSVCARPFGVCGKVKYNTFLNIINTCQTSNCPNSIQYYTDSNNATIPYCPYPAQLSTQSDFQQGATFYRNVDYTLAMTFENKCILNDPFSTLNCLKEEDGICKICKENYYPIQYKVMPYFKDAIESYVVHSDKISIGHANLENCIVYDSKEKKCMRCDNKYKMTSSFKCILCDSEGKVSDYQDLYCLFFGFPSITTGGVCSQAYEKQLGGDQKLTKCLKCHQDYVEAYKIGFQARDQLKDANGTNPDYQELYEQYFYLNDDNGSKSFQGQAVLSWYTKFCKKIDEKIFYSDINLSKYNQNCGWGMGTQDEFYCMVCKFGYYGDRGVTQGGNTFIQGCVPDSNCNTKVQYFIEEPWIRNFITCHQCAIADQIPSTFLYFDQFTTNESQLFWIYNQPEAGIKKTTLCTAPKAIVPNNCFSQVKIDSAVLKALLNSKYDEPTKRPYIYFKQFSTNLDSSFTQYTSAQMNTFLTNSNPIFICTVCKPGYAPFVYQTNTAYPLYFYLFATDPNPFPNEADHVAQAEKLKSGRETFFYPMKFIHQCVIILNCKESLTTNKCDVCEKGYYLTHDKMRCSPTPDNKDKLCEVFAADQTTCSQCKKGYVLTDMCVPYIVDGCKFYQNDKCVQAKSTMGVQYSIIYRAITYEYKVKSNECLDVSAKIENCLLYAANQLCQVCKKGYYLKQGTFEICDNFNIPYCLEKKYTGDNLECTKCATGYKLVKNTFTVVEKSSTILTVICEADTSTSPNSGCAQWAEGLCTKCADENYAPIKVNNNQETICVDINVSLLCEEWDLEVLGKTKQISCKKCRKITEIQTGTHTLTIGGQSFKIDQYDFIQFEDYQNMVDAQNRINYSVLTNQYPELRAALYKTDDINWCRNFKPIQNCILYDNSSLDSTFQCLECSSDFYLISRLCQRRANDYSNCFLKFIDRDECKLTGSQSSYSITYSSFDVYVMSQAPPSFSSSSVIQILIIENCEVYRTSSYCEKCEKGFYLYDNLCLKSSKIVADCSYYITDGICEQCAENFFLQQNKCFQIYAHNCADLLTNTKCLFCPNTHPMQQSDGSCYKNNDVPYCEIYQSLELCFKCEKNFYNYKGQCLPVGMTLIENCLLQIEGEICIECKAGYSLQADQKSCFKNPLFDKKCKTFKNQLTCSMCEIGHYLINEKCYPCLTDSLRCQFCDPFSPSKCILCRSGFFMNANLECVKSTVGQNQVEVVMDQVLINIENLFGRDEVIRRFH